MRRRTLFAILSLTPCFAAAQEPVHVPFACSEDEVQSVGLICTEDEPCSIFLELNAVAPAGQKLFLAGDLHAVSGTISSILLSSDDSGVTWKEASTRIRGAALEHLQFHDSEHGWAAGEIQYPLPQDPFLLVSSDGGASWRQRPVTDDGGPGSVQHFWFDSAQHGELVVDAGRRAPSGRYLDYESETGGESWMLRSTTGNMPKLKRAPPLTEGQDFRIRPASNGKTYQIEKRVGEKWASASSFLIEVATCKIKPPELKNPEPGSPPPPRD